MSEETLARLEVIQEGRREEFHITKRRFRIGRAPDNDLALSDLSVSKYHAQMILTNQGWKLSDQGSANGTYVDGERLFTLDSRIVANGSSIKIGNVYLVLHIGAVDQPATPAPTAVLPTPDVAPPRTEEEALLNQMAAMLSNDTPATPPAEPPPAAPRRRRGADALGSALSALETPDSPATEAPPPVEQVAVSASEAPPPAETPADALPPAETPADALPPAETPADATENEDQVAAEDALVPGLVLSPLKLAHEVWMLQVTYANNQQREVTLNVNPFLIGRARENNLALNDGLVSKQHAQLAFTRGVWQIYDLGTLNGTHVDGQRLPTRGSRVLAEGSRFEIGGTTFVVQRQVWQLAITHRSGRREEVELTISPFRIGRSNANNYVLNDTNVGGAHVEMIYEDNVWKIIDLGSEFGTFVDGTRLLSQYPQALTNRSSIQIGNTQLSLFLAERKSARADEPAASADDTGRRSRVLSNIFADLDRKEQPAAAEPETQPDAVVTAPTTPEPAPQPLPAARSAQPAVPPKVGEAVTKAQDIPAFQLLVVNPIRNGLAAIAQGLGLSDASQWLNKWLGVEFDPGGDAQKAAMDRVTGQSTAPISGAPTPPAGSSALLNRTGGARLTALVAAGYLLPDAGEASVLEGDLPLIQSSDLLYLLPTATNLIVSPGQSITIGVTVTNRSTIVDRITPGVVGVPQEWVTIVPENLALFPNTTGDAQITITPPRDSSALAGLHHMALVARSAEYTTEQVAVRATLTLMPFTEFTFDLTPKQQGALRRTTYTAEITNLGNQVEAFVLAGRDDEEICRFAYTPETVIVAPGKSRRVRTNVQLSKWHWFGLPVTHFFNLSTVPLDSLAAPREATGRLIRLPVISYAMLVLIIVLLLILLGPLLIRTYIAMTTPVPSPTPVPSLNPAIIAEVMTPTVTIAPTDVPLPTLEPTLEPIPTLEPLPVPTPDLSTPTPEPVVVLPTPVPAPTSPPPPPTAVPPTPVPPTATPIPPTPTPSIEVQCVAGSPVRFEGRAAPNVPLLLFFNERPVGGGNTDGQGFFSITMTIGDERPGSYPVTVRVRGTDRVVLEKVCIVP